MHGLSLLNSKGTFSFVTSNSWLDVGYGRDLQEFLLANCPIYLIMDNRVKRTFKNADVNTVICVFGAPVNAKQKERLKLTTPKFVMAYVPYEQILSPIVFEEIEESTEIKSCQEYRVVPKSTAELFENGSDPEKVRISQIDAYTGDKWGGKYLRAPDIYYTILEKGKGKFVRLGDIAEVRFGIKTGANEFFYLTQEQIVDWGIEEEFLKPVIKNPRESNTIDLSKSKLQYMVLMCHRPKKQLKGLKIIKYIEYGENCGYHLRPTCSTRNIWYDLGIWKTANCFWMESINEINRVYINPGYLFESDKFYGITFINNNNVHNKSVLLNATLYSLLRELKGFHGMGQGVLKLPVYDVKNIEYVDVNIENQLKIIVRPQYSIFVECGINKNESIRAQTPNPLPDRKALDDIVFDVIGLTQAERNEVYWAVCELVQQRLAKAGSV